MPSATMIRGALMIALIAGVTTVTQGQGAAVDYRRAERFLGDEIKKLVFDGQVTPQWIDEGSRFWYMKEGPEGKAFVVVDPAQGSRAPAFDHQRLAASVSVVLGTTYSANSLPFNSIRFVDGTRTLRAAGVNLVVSCDLDSYNCSRVKDLDDDGEERPRGGPPRPPAAGEVPPRADVPSPDKTLTAFVQDHNLWIRNLKTGESIQLSRDGEHFYDYATPLPTPVLMLQQGTENVIQTPAVFWSPDSTKIATYVMDQRNFPRLTMTQSAPRDQFRPKYFSYAYPLPVDFDLPTSKLVVFDIVKRKQIAVAARPLTQLYYGGPRVEWTADSRRFMYREIERGYAHIRLRDVDAATGVSRTILDETGDPLVDNSIIATRGFNGGREVVWSAERDGWNHFYLYDAEKAVLKNQITKGDWVIRAIDHIDETKRVLYFTGAGREAGRDPYLRHTYRVNLDGTGLTLLTPEDADHAVSFSPDGQFFVDAYSRPNVPTVSVLRRAETGQIVSQLETADASRLMAMGWTMPEPFRGKAADGQTDLYGLIWRPTNFDPKKKYAVIENIYTGPQSAFVPKTFAAYRHQQQAIAELGFITVFVDGRGTALRSRAFRNVSYKNLGQGSGGDDHIAIFKQMAAKYPYMDLTRVGVWGHSAGGYDSTHAILTHPEFYKVAVSSAGCHDNRMDKATWNEQWMGWPVDKHYEEQSNYTLAPNLKGKLFLAHGDVDENVPLPATIKLVDALVTANKDFDFLIMPNRMHGFGNDPYFVRRRWDYFVRHLLGVEPRSSEPRVTTTQQP
ncbi:MAG: DPP IV N-terminal domain-containing protein [Vicinamibacterales bacterium]